MTFANNLILRAPADVAQEADAVLTVRERLHGGGDDLVNDARAAGQAIFSMKSGSPPSIIKAIRALAGIDPSPFSLRDVSAAVSPRSLAPM